MVKRALLVGCNYPATKAELHGCINDVNRMHRSLIDRFGFHPRNIRVMIDTDPASQQPTGANIRRAMEDLVRGCQEGDVLFFHYSGHGVQIPAESGEPDDTGYDECIVPCDMNLITDDDFREIVNKLPAGCPLTIVSDSCHSGGLISHEKQQIGVVASQHTSHESAGSSNALKGLIMEGVHGALESRGIHLPFRNHHSHHKRPSERNWDHHREVHYTGVGHAKSRALSLSTFLELFEEKTGRHGVTVGNIRPSLFDVFGEDASPKVKKFVSLLVGRLQSGESEGLWGTVGGLAQDFLKAKLEESDDSSEYVKPALDTAATSHQLAYAGSNPELRKKRSVDMGILVSGCQSDETSADANPTGNPKEAYGALSNAVQVILSQANGSITNHELVTKVRKYLADQGFKQHPCLFCSDENVQSVFICE